MKKTYIVNDLRCEKFSSFPIAQIIEDYRKENTEAKVLILLPEEKGNWEVDLDELLNLGIKKAHIKSIRAEDRTQSSLLKFMKIILEEIPDESEIYVDITNTSQLLSSVLIYTINLAEKMKDCEIERILCREGPECAAEDLSIFKMLGDIAEQMKILGICRKKEIMRQLFIKSANDLSDDYKYNSEYGSGFNGKNYNGCDTEAGTKSHGEMQKEEDMLISGKNAGTAVAKKIRKRK